MITIKENTLERISTWTKDSIYVLTDFDHTLTSGDSTTSWGILEDSTYLPAEYNQERQKLSNHYGPIEFDETIPEESKKISMNEWWTKHLNLFIKYRLSEEAVLNETSSLKTMILRPGTKELLKKLADDKIPVIIVSAGIGNYIESCLKSNNCYYDNIHIISNFLKFENSYATGIKSNLIHSLNKNEVSLSNEIKEYIQNRKNIILFGDHTGDTNMTQDKNALKIGFLEKNVTQNKPYYEEKFDLVCIESDFNEIINTITIL